MMADSEHPNAPGSAVPNLPHDPWASLRAATSARIGLGRSGDTMPLRPVLDFQLAHAEARDAVHAALDVESLAQALAPHRVVTVRSAVADRSLYLRRPDLGRILDPASRAALEGEAAATPYDCVFVIADGLSAVAAQRHAVSLIERCLPYLASLSIAPIVIATQARVALGDAVGECLRARLCVMLIGERPGLSVADSLGAYITFAPQTGRRDSERNCISNIHTKGGLDYDLAARKLGWLITEALRRQTTGIALKDDGDASLLAGHTPSA
jgi:ethanolamine ammonia-lyase small subunit